MTNPIITDENGVTREATDEEYQAYVDQTIAMYEAGEAAEDLAEAYYKLHPEERPRSSDILCIDDVLVPETLSAMSVATM